MNLQSLTQHESYHDTFYVIVSMNSAMLDKITGLIH